MLVDEVLEKVLDRVVPSFEESRGVARVVERVLRALDGASHELGADVVAEVEGSFAKDTWLADDVDVDIFLLFSPDVPLEELRRQGLLIARRAAEALGAEWEERYASHPYLTLKVEGYRVDVVPAYRVASPAEIRSPVDRTPFHTEYVRERLQEKPGLKDDIRLLKRFAKGVGVYGAEIKVEGFSGYLLELLALYYGSFKTTITAVATWRPYRTVIDMEHHYESWRDALKRFHDPLVVVDPVDPRRNVASPVSLSSMCRFIAASRAFLRAPSIDFFYPSERPGRPLGELLRSRGVVAIKTYLPKIPEDVLWGQVKRALRALSNGLERLGFTVYSSDAWASGGELVLLLELEALTLSPLEKHYGPPVYSDHNERFLKKYLREGAVAGPYVEGDRWVVIRRRKLRGVKEALAKLISAYNLGERITECLRRGYEVYVGPCAASASSNPEYRTHLASWLERRYPWLSS